jgi:DNA-directed RNA polymerase delta subunit/uncharacterized tellurite resistance protein B-like protein
LEFPSQADHPIVVLLMAVVKADDKVLKEETDLVHSFFSRQLRVPAKRLSRIRTLVARYAREDISSELLETALEKIPDGARELIFSQAVDIAIVDDELSPGERDRLLIVGKHFGLSEREIRGFIREAVSRREDAFSLLEVTPDSDWEEIEVAFEKQKKRYALSHIAGLGIAFQNLALERLDRIDWAFETLQSIYSSDGSKDGGGVSVEVEPLKLESLDLPSSFQSRLERAEIETREQLKELLSRDKVKGMRAKTRKMFEHLLGCLREATDGTGNFHREIFDQLFPQRSRVSRAERDAKEKPLFPTEVPANEREAWGKFPEILGTLWKSDEREWDVLVRRIGLEGHPIETLQDIADSYAVSRERVRQLESRGKRKIRSFLLRGELDRQQAHPAVVDLSEKILGAIQAALVEYVSPLSGYVRSLETNLGWSIYSSQGLFSLFEEWASVSHDSSQDCQFVFREHDHSQVKAFNSAMKAARQYLSSLPCGARLAELVEGVSEFEPRLRCSVEQCVMLAPQIERHQDGSFLAPFHSLTRANQAFRILHDEGKPVHFRELADKVNARLDDEYRVEANNLRNQLVADDRFQPVGRSGEWSLTQWEHVETGSILEVIEKILTESEAEMSVAELTEAVQSQRTCSDHSILAYLCTEERFLRTGPDSYTLAERADQEADWSRQEIGGLVEEFFHERLHSDVQFKSLVEYVAGKADVNGRVAWGILRHHPAVVKSREDGELYASLRPNWRGAVPADL